MNSLLFETLGLQGAIIDVNHADYLRATTPTSLRATIGAEHFGLLMLGAGMPQQQVPEAFRLLAEPIGLYDPRHATNFKAAKKYWKDGGEQSMNQYIMERNANPEGSTFPTYFEWLATLEAPKAVVDRDTGLAYGHRTHNPHLRMNKVPSGLLPKGRNEVILYAGPFINFGNTVEDLKTIKDPVKAKFIRIGAALLASHIDHHQTNKKR